MIKFLAQLFRGLHFIVGISAPPPGTNDRRFVFTWLGGHCVHRGLLHDSGLLHHPYFVLQALRDAWHQQPTKKVSTTRANTQALAHFPSRQFHGA